MSETNKKDLLNNLNEKIKDLLQEKRSLELKLEKAEYKIVRLEEELQEIRINFRKALVGDDLKKLILKEFSRNKNAVSIHKELGKTYDITIDEIEDIIKNIDKLSIDLIEYYKREVEAFKDNDLLKFLSEQDQIKDSIDNTLFSLDKQILLFSDKKDMGKEDFKMYMELLTKKNIFINSRLKLTDTYKEDNIMQANQKENGNAIAVEIKKNVTNILNINNLIEKGVEVEEVGIDSTVEALK